MVELIEPVPTASCDRCGHPAKYHRDLNQCQIATGRTSIDRKIRQCWCDCFFPKVRTA